MKQWISDLHITVISLFFFNPLINTQPPFDIWNLGSLYETINFIGNEEVFLFIKQTQSWMFHSEFIEVLILILVFESIIHEGQDLIGLLLKVYRMKILH